MRKKYREELDCQACDKKLENCVKQTDGVVKCSVNLMTQKLVIQSEGRDPQEIIEEIAKKMKKIDDDVVIDF